MPAYGDNHAQWGAAALSNAVPLGNIDERHDAQEQLHDAAEAVMDAVDDLMEVVGMMMLEGRSSDRRPTVEVAQARVEVEQRRFAAMVDEALELAKEGGR